MTHSRLVYVTDPLCLWCYGISSVIEDFSQQLPSNIITETLMLLAEPFGVSQKDFLEFYLSEECLDLTRQQYAEAKQLGISSFLALLYINGNQGYSLATGYATLDNITKAFTWAQEQSQSMDIPNENVCTDKGCVS